MAPPHIKLSIIFIIICLESADFETGDADSGDDFDDGLGLSWTSKPFDDLFERKYFRRKCEQHLLFRSIRDHPDLQDRHSNPHPLPHWHRRQKCWNLETMVVD